jgi:hypothetical protein
MLFVVELATAVLIGIIIGRWKSALLTFTVLYLLHAIPAALGWYGALSEWDDVPYWIAGFLLDALLVLLGVRLRRIVQRHIGRRPTTGAG